MKRNKTKKWHKKLTAISLVGMMSLSTVIPQLSFPLSPIPAEASDTIVVTQNDSSRKQIESSQLRVWMRDNGRYGLQLKSNGATIFYATDSAHIYILRNGSFPTSGLPSNFSSFPLKSFHINGTTIEQIRTDGVFDYIFRLSIINATSQGAYMKAELEMKNLTGSYQNVGASFNMDTMVNGNDHSPFRIIPNGWEAFHNGVQVTAYYQGVYGVTQADAIYLGHYASQRPMPINSFTVGQVIHPGDSGAGFYYNLKPVAPYESRKESWIIGLGPRNSNPTFTVTSPAENQTFYRGQTLQISGTARDEDVGDTLQIKWAIDGGAENLLTSIVANGQDQPFNYNYTLPDNLADGWHTLQIWAMDDKGGVSSANTRRFYINNFVVPGQPTFSNVKEDSFTVTFDKRGNVDTTTYELYKVHNGQTVDLGNKNTLIETGLTPNTLYQYKVRAKNTSNVYTDYSPIGSIYTLAKQPTAGNVDASINGQVTMSWGANGNPSGTKYHYEVRRSSDNTVVKSGETTATSVTVTGLPTDTYYKLYVRAINGDGVETEDTYLGQVYQDTISPSVTISTNTNAWTNGNVTIQINATDEGSGIQAIELPNGNRVSSANTATYVVSENGSYTFKVTDKAGNITEKTVTINNIDKQQPTATHTIEHVDGNSFKVTINAEDDGSGVKQIKLPNGEVYQGNQATYTVEKGQQYSFEIVDQAGNKLPYEVKVNVPDLTVYQKENHVKAEWAIEMLPEDVIYQTGFEDGEEIPSLVWADGKLGGQSITTEDKFSGSKSLKIHDTYTNGNWYQFPATSGTKSIVMFKRKYFPNGTDLSLTFKAKSDVGGLLMPNGDGGWGETIVTLSNVVRETAPKGSKTIKLNHVNGLYLGNWITTDTDQKQVQAMYQIREIDTVNNTITLHTGIVRDMVAGENLKTRPWRGAWSFNTRMVPGNNQWTTFSVNTKVATHSDYDVAIRGGSFYIGSQTSGTIYVDDVQFGYATKAQLFRGNTKIYEGYLSDYEDTEAIDKMKPDKVASVNIKSEQGKIYMDIQKPEDKGTEYTYTVKAISHKGDSVSSEKKKVTVVSGIDGYSYVIDKQPSTIPDNIIDTRNEKTEIPITTNEKYYIHIKAIDKEGNVSDVTHIPFQDSIAPTLNVTHHPTEWTNSSVVISVEASDDGLGIKRIQLPDGTWVNGDKATYTVHQNGTYTFVAEDLVGNRTSKSITITNIDKTAPTAPSISNYTDWTKDTPVQVTITSGVDTQSGVDRVEYKLEGATTKNWITYTSPILIYNEGITKVTARTVDKLGHVSPETVSYVKIDKSAPHNTGIIIRLKP
jgi:hypothetical protein